MAQGSALPSYTFTMGAMRTSWDDFVYDDDDGYLDEAAEVIPRTLVLPSRSFAPQYLLMDSSPQSRSDSFALVDPPRQAFSEHERCPYASRRLSEPCAHIMSNIANTMMRNFAHYAMRDITTDFQQISSASLLMLRMCCLLALPTEDFIERQHSQIRNYHRHGILLDDLGTHASSDTESCSSISTADSMPGLIDTD